MLAFQRNPDKLEAKALTYEQRGKTAKALKYRQKAMRLRQNTTGGALATPMPMTTTRTPAMYEQNALKWEQRNNWTKAQKNREKAWRLNNPQYMNTAAPAFYQNNKFLGYNVPVTGTTLSGLPLSGARSTGAPLSGLSRNPQSLEQKALAYEQRGKPMKAQKYREKAMRLRQHQATGATSMPWNPRTSARYEQNALKWEQRNNWTKAQKNREKVWRLNNPQQSTFAAPMFYQNNKFVGYNQPFTNLPLTSMTNAPLSGNAASTGLPLVGGLSRNPDTLEQRALAYQQKGKPLKAQKYREKAMRLRQHQTTGATGMPWTARSPARYEQNALKWEQRNNWTKAQKNREKVWRLNNPQQSTFAAPMFYQSNRFVGYNQPFTNQPRLGLGLNQPGLSLNKPGMGQMGTHTIFNAPIVEQIVRPTIVDQTMRPERITEIQPIVHREIEAPQVRIVEKHLYETVPSAGPSTITNAPIIQETVMPRIIQEVQPVVHREVPAPFIEKVEQHVTEHIVKPTITTKEIQGANAGIAPVAAGGPRPILNNNLNNRPL